MSSESQDGFVLPLVLAVLIALAAFATTISDWLAGALGIAIHGEDRIAADARLMSVRDTALWRLTTEHFTPAGLGGGAGVIALDGRVYDRDGVALRLMDERGLFSLTETDEERLRRFLRAFDLSPGQESALAGAFIADRTRHGPLLTPWDLRRIPEWAETAALWREGQSVADLAGIGRVQGINLNTAPAPVLESLAGMTPGVAASLIEARERNPIMVEDTLLAITGAEQRPDPLHAFLAPADTIRLSLRTPGEPLTWVLSVTVTPAGAAPVKINFAVDLPDL